MKTKRSLLLFKVDQVLVVLENLDVGESAPGSLNFFCCDNIFRFLSHFLSSLLVTTPSPLNLDRSDMIHSKAMILEKTSCERHFVCCLDQAGTKVSHALLLILCHHIEPWGQKLLSQVLSGREVLHLRILNWAIHIVTDNLLSLLSLLLYTE